MKQTFRLLLVLTAVFVSTEYAFGQTKYPHTKWGADDNGVVIVSRDDKGGVHPDALKGDAGFSIEALLQIKPKDEDDKVSWADAQVACVGGWRLPTKRELQLIWLMGGANSGQYSNNTGLAIESNQALNVYTNDEFVPLSYAEYWTSTAGGWYVSFENGKVANSTADSRKVRCVKSEEDELSLYPSGTFAYSNIVLKDGKLIFATRRDGTSNAAKGVYTNNDVPANSQGLYFKWGSLIGLSSNGTNGSTAFAAANVVFKPTGYSGNPTTWANVPYMTDAYTYNTTTDHISITYPIATTGGYKVADGKGDICRYISDQGWVEGRWRMPKASEIQSFAESTPGKTGNYYGIVSTSPAWGNIVTSGTNATTGMFQINNGWWFGTEVKNNSIANTANKTMAPEGTRYFPAGGYRNYSDGKLYDQGTYGDCWSSSAYNASSSYDLNFNSSAAHYPNSHARSHGFPVRCVAE